MNVKQVKSNTVISNNPILVPYLPFLSEIDKKYVVIPDKGKNQITKKVWENMLIKLEAAGYLAGGSPNWKPTQIKYPT